MRVRRRATIALFAAVACKRAQPPAPLEERDDAAQPNVTSLGAAPDGGFVAARCTLVDGDSARATLHELGDRRSLEVGEGAATSSGLAVGIVHAPANGPEALIASTRTTAGGSEVDEWVVAKRGEVVPDAPPPKPLVAANALYAAYVARGAAAAGDQGRSRRLVLKKAGVEAPIAAYAQRTSESLAFDAALSADATRAAVVWDEDAVAGAGGITLAVVPLAGGQPPAPRVVSGETADPDGPRLAPRLSGGWWVAWTAHRPEAPAEAGVHGGGAAEAPAEERVYSWIEVVVVGDDGTPSGPPRRVTSALGHVASFDLAPRPAASVQIARAHSSPPSESSSRALDLVIRDETQLREGEGGRILHVVVAPDGASEEVSVIVQAGVGRGSVDLVTGLTGDAWLSFLSAQDRTLLLPLGPARSGLGGPSVEEVLEGGRLIALENAGERTRFIAAFPGTDAVNGPLFREVACAP